MWNLSVSIRVLHTVALKFSVFSVLLFQGISLRKVLLQNYLFPTKKNNQKDSLAELGAAGKFFYTTVNSHIVDGIFLFLQTILLFSFDIFSWMLIHF